MESPGPPGVSIVHTRMQRWYGVHSAAGEARVWPHACARVLRIGSVAGTDAAFVCLCVCTLPQEKVGKQPYYVYYKDGPPMKMAGLFDVWDSAQGPVHTYTILTTDAAPRLQWCAAARAARRRACAHRVGAAKVQCVQRGARCAAATRTHIARTTPQCDIHPPTGARKSARADAAPAPVRAPLCVCVAQAARPHARAAAQ